jgi:hypothetical protein
MSLRLVSKWVARMWLYSFNDDVGQFQENAGGISLLLVDARRFPARKGQ